MEINEKYLNWSLKNSSEFQRLTREKYSAIKQNDDISFQNRKKKLEVIYLKYKKNLFFFIKLYEYQENTKYLDEIKNLFISDKPKTSGFISPRGKSTRDFEKDKKIYNFFKNSINSQNKKLDSKNVSSFLETKNKATKLIYPKKHKNLSLFSNNKLNIETNFDGKNNHFVYNSTSTTKYNLNGNIINNSFYNTNTKSIINNTTKNSEKIKAKEIKSNSINPFIKNNIKNSYEKLFNFSKIIKKKNIKNSTDTIFDEISKNENLKKVNFISFGFEKNLIKNSPIKKSVFLTTNNSFSKKGKNILKKLNCQLITNRDNIECKNLYLNLKPTKLKNIENNLKIKNLETDNFNEDNSLNYFDNHEKKNYKNKDDLKSGLDILEGNNFDISKNTINFCNISEEDIIFQEYGEKYKRNHRGAELFEPIVSNWKSENDHKINHEKMLLQKIYKTDKNYTNLIKQAKNKKKLLNLNEYQKNLINKIGNQFSRDNVFKLKDELRDLEIKAKQFQISPFRDFMNDVESKEKKIVKKLKKRENQLEKLKNLGNIDQKEILVKLK